MGYGFDSPMPNAQSRRATVPRKTLRDGVSRRLPIKCTTKRYAKKYQIEWHQNAYCR